ncbi:L-2-hydroxyglutarate dehydrogenase [Thraustotheca clavata]|uniref:L-2-hydroxyglutarate dehydrogenase, mitochondrial n=1 Tax=Thraustotheca clavata TaxID=74557 RepID=A0A1V9Y812_9STRA|nr:L-2-hydroxyglutarate dehydrogenase [Thraustotheca clavata]
MVDKLVAIIGSGAVGLAVARSIARKGFQVIVLEQHQAIGMECSSRNSEVIHAGLYYPQKSLKALLCVKGKQLMYDFCQEFNVPVKQCGKLVVASSIDQMEQLNAIKAKAIGNGVNDVKILSKEQVAEIESDVKCQGALFSPSTGIVDSHTLMLAMQGDAEAHGANFALNCTVAGGKMNKDGSFDLLTHQTGSPDEVDPLTVDMVVNAAGLYAPRIANLFKGGKQSFKVHQPTMFAKGSYFRLGSMPKMPFSHLIYPIPEKGGLGVHATLDMEGNIRFGPDVEWIPDFDYQVNPAKAEIFASKIQEYWPSIVNAELIPDYSGIRPKIVGPGEKDADFTIYDEKNHGMKGLIHLCGIESPGLTSCLAIGDLVAERIASQA